MVFRRVFSAVDLTGFQQCSGFSTNYTNTALKEKKYLKKKMASSKPNEQLIFLDRLKEKISTYIFKVLQNKI